MSVISMQPVGVVDNTSIGDSADAVDMNVVKALADIFFLASFALEGMDEDSLDLWNPVDDGYDYADFKEAINAHPRHIKKDRNSRGYFIAPEGYEKDMNRGFKRIKEAFSREIEFLRAHRGPMYKPILSAYEVDNTSIGDSTDTVNINVVKALADIFFRASLLDKLGMDVPNTWNPLYNDPFVHFKEAIDAHPRYIKKGGYFVAPEGYEEDMKIGFKRIKEAFKKEIEFLREHSGPMYKPILVADEDD